jgi:hypothetical protein
MEGKTLEPMVLLLGAVGGVLPDLLRIAKAKGDIRQVGGATVLISMVVLAIIGAVAAVAADSTSADAPTVLASLTAGFTGPEVISRLVGSGSSGQGGRPVDTQSVDTRSRLFSWWTV